jgi:hypothetical protein
VAAFRLSHDAWLVRVPSADGRELEGRLAVAACRGDIAWAGGEATR